MNKQRIQSSPMMQLSSRLTGRKSRRLAGLFILTAFAMATYYVSSPPPSKAQFTPSADLVISQIYGAGGNSLASFDDDFVEIYNRGNGTVTFSNWSVQYTNDTGTT